eukprot:CAMPEP_0197575764 /NCGR_PEP_ID=MMETSP1326-20131121/1044_1 /TAXON_ID=1155430 /ORGANISM="Genus nov. species nov., Strain RCC2288" /LENGTH=346 /DNA_ID=CAMNT_0043138583 /DNA_START=85 /DNA_END=1125 /DNA_ORIENTATION=-
MAGKAKSSTSGGGGGLTEAKFAIAVSGIFFAFSYFAVLQEDVYRKSYGGERFKATFLVLVVERGVNTLAGLLGVLLFGGSGVKVPVTEILSSGVSQMLAMAASNEALRYVSFATQVLGKSCKMVPVMVGGIAAGRKFPTSQYVQVMVITLGVVIFNFGAKKGGAGEDSAYGLTLIGLSLVMDFATSMSQDRVKAATKRANPGVERAKTSMFESMLWTNASGTLIALALALATGHLTDGVAFCTKNPEVTRAIGLYAVASVVGQLFIYFTITEFDPLVLSTVTTTRKIFSTVYSVLRSPGNSLSGVQWSGCGVVFAMLGWEVLEKYLHSRGAAKTRMKLARADNKKA